jgi:hypothetical protein
MNHIMTFLDILTTIYFHLSLLNLTVTKTFIYTVGKTYPDQNQFNH